MLCCHTAGSGNHWDPAISIDDDQIVVFLEFSIIHRDLLEGSISDCSNVRSPRLGRRVSNTFFTPRYDTLDVLSHVGPKIVVLSLLNTPFRPTVILMELVQNV